MKKRLIATIIRSKFFVPSILVASNAIFIPSLHATTYNTTVDLSSGTVMINGDVIDTTDLEGLVSKNVVDPALSITGSDSIEIKVNTSLLGNDATGVYFNNGKTNTFGENSKIIVNHTGSGETRGVYVGSNTNIEGKALTVDVTSAKTAYGIFANSGSLIDLKTGSIVNVKSSANIVRGILLSSSNNTLKADSLRLDVQSNGRLYGIEANGDKNLVDLGSSSYIHLSGQVGSAASSTGIYLSGTSQLKANALTIDVNNASGIKAAGSVSTNLGSGSKITLTNQSGIKIAGFAATGNSNDKIDFYADRLEISTTGKNSLGMDLNNGANDINLGTGSVIKTTGEFSQGVVLNSHKDALFQADGLTIHTQGKDAEALEVETGKVEIRNGSSIRADVSNAVVVSNNSAVIIKDSEIFSGGYHAVTSKSDGSVIDLDNVNISGKNSVSSFGLYAVNKGKISANNTTIDIDSTSLGRGVLALSEGEVVLTGNTTIKSKQLSDTAIQARVNGKVTGSGKMLITGNLLSDGGGNISLNMNSGSVLRGNTTQATDPTIPLSPIGLINLTMDNSLWELNDTSEVNDLTLSGGSIVDFQTNGNKVLTIKNLSHDAVSSSGGVFWLGTDIVAGIGDKVEVTGTTEGNHKVHIKNRGSDQTDGTETLIVIDTADGKGSFTLDKKVELGGYEYDLRQVGTDWELYSSGKARSSTSKAASSFVNVGYLMNYAEVQTLFQRIGDIRQNGNTFRSGASGADSTYVNNNVWGRVFHGTYDSFAGNQMGQFRMKYRGGQIGVDKAIRINGDGAFYIGTFGSISDSRQSYDYGSSEMTSYSAGVYGSYMTGSLFYIDLMAKYQHHKFDLDVVDSQGSNVKGDGNSHGLSVSAETGKRFHFNTQPEGFYIEPQLQLIYSWNDGAEVNNSNGLKVDLGRYNSLLGRAGASIGYEANMLSDTPVNFYFKNSWLHEFMGDSEYQLNGSKEKLSFDGGAWVSGVGVSAEFNRKHTIFIDMEKTKGDKFEQDQFNLGYRFHF